MRVLYTLLLTLLMPFVVLRLFWRSIKYPAYRKRIRERFAIYPIQHSEETLWIHAVSLGEVLLISPVIKALLQDSPKRHIILTTTTPSGSERVQAQFEGQVTHVYAPYDLPFIVNRFLKKMNIKQAIMVETEIWPNTFYLCHQHKIPLIIANARLAERSFKAYQRVASLVRQTLSYVDLVAAQTEADANRFIALGLDPQKAVVTGNIKFDMPLTDDLPQKTALLREQLGAHRPIWIAASTHEGEEKIVLNSFKQILQDYPNALLVLVPRHPDRFQQVYQLCINQGFEVVRRSTQEPCTPQTQIFLGDTLGELLLFYGVCDVAFVGGSFAPIGGHNLLEPALWSKPTITATHMHNFVQITQLLLDADALIQIQQPEQLAESVLALFANPSRAQQLGQNACAVVEQNRGALCKHLELIHELSN